MSEEILPRIHWLASFPKSGNTGVRSLHYAYQYGSISLQQMKGHVDRDQIPPAWFAASPIPWGFLTGDQKILLRYPALMVLMSMNVQPTVIVKTHCANVKLNSVELIPEELTTSSIYLVRDPRDVCISYAHHMGIEIDDSIERMASVGCALDMGSTGIVQATGSWSLNVQSWHESGHFKREVIRYEDLQDNPTYELKRIIEHIYKEDADILRVRRAVELCEFEKLKKLEQQNGFQEATKHGEFFRKGKSTWKEVLTPEQVASIETTHGEWMCKLGYELSTAKAA